MTFKGLFGGFSPFDPLKNQGFSFVRIAPTHNLYPFSGLKILIVLKKMFDLVQGDFWQIGIIFDALVAPGQFNARHGNNFFIHAGFIFHDQDANRLHAHNGAGNNRTGIGNDNIAGIAIVR